MCTLLMYRNPLPGVILAVAANRDELYRRGRGTFEMLSEEPPVVGGRDPEQGGTWLAAGARGFVVAVTNARLQARRREDQRSRGLLALDLAMMSSVEAASRQLEAENLDRYAPVNVVVGSPDGFTVATNTPEPRWASLSAGALGVGNRPLFLPDERVARLLEMGSPGAGEDAGGWADRLRLLLARHEPPVACHHQPRGGTVSSTVALLGAPFGQSRIWHADGPPCRRPWRRVDVGVPSSRPKETLR